MKTLAGITSGVSFNMIDISKTHPFYFELFLSEHDVNELVGTIVENVFNGSQDTFILPWYDNKGESEWCLEVNTHEKVIVYFKTEENAIMARMIV